ncbi:MAG: hypothetical protein ACQETZ_11155 [Candidatus Fermentibacterota bacterium]
MLALGGNAYARSIRPLPPLEDEVKARPPVTATLHNLSKLWTVMYNVDRYGDPEFNYPSMQWPGGEDNNYLYWGSYWCSAYGAVTPDAITDYYVSATEYGGYEFWASDGYPMQKVTPGPVALEQTTWAEDDWYPTYQEDPMGIMCHQTAYSWGTPGYNEFLVNELVYTHHSQYGNPEVPLDGFVMSMWGDCDIATIDASEGAIDDMVFYDGHAIWCNDPDATFEYEFDDGTPASEADWYTYQQNPDASYEDPEDNIYYYYNYHEPDGIVDADVDGNGVSDHFTVIFKFAGSDTVYSVEPNTGLELFADGMPENYWEHTVGDTTYAVVPRNTSYMWDADHPGSSIDDSGEPSLSPPCNGYIGWRLLDVYRKPAGSDSITRPLDVHGVPIPLSHGWWNWESDPGTDFEIYKYQWGENPDMSGRRSAPSYLADWVGDENAPLAFECENPGPWPIVHEVPTALGYPSFDYRFLLSMGPVDLADGDSLFVVGGWIVSRGLDGLRQSADNMLDAYYRDGGWGIPDLPPMPTLFYEADDGSVNLQWGANAETYTPFGGYRIYRARFQTSGWELVADINGPGTYSYTDTDVVNGYPYFYVVCAYDQETDIESPRSNYRQTVEGTPLPVTPGWDANSNWTEEVSVVPNPYRGSAAWEQTYFDKIAFTNLPASCNIDIYTLAGDHVITLEHYDASGESGTEYWDLLSRNDQAVTSGLYVYRVETEEDYVIGKLAIIR